MEEGQAIMVHLKDKDTYLFYTLEESNTVQKISWCVYLDALFMPSYQTIRAFNSAIKESKYNYDTLKDVKISVCRNIACKEICVRVKRERQSETIHFNILDFVQNKVHPRVSRLINLLDFAQNTVHPTVSRPVESKQWRLSQVDTLDCFSIFAKVDAGRRAPFEQLELALNPSDCLLGKTSELNHVGQGKGMTLS